jgi:sigma-B regulation protein RsbQ
VDPIIRNAPNVTGQADGQPIVFAHGFGCDSNMWRFIAPRYEHMFKVVTFDHVGHGRSDPSAFDVQRYSSLAGYATDVVELCRALELQEVIFVGHSVSAMIGGLAAAREPQLFDKLVMVGPSPRYIDAENYVGGFAEADIIDMLDSLDSNYLGWSSSEFGAELTASFCRTDPTVAKHFARVTFMSDNREDLAKVSVPTLVLQCSSDVIAPVAVGVYVRDQLPNAAYRLLEATGHCPNLSAPDETAAAIDEFIGVTR